MNLNLCLRCCFFGLEVDELVLELLELELATDEVVLVSTAEDDVVELEVELVAGVLLYGLAINMEELFEEDEVTVLSAVADDTVLVKELLKLLLTLDIWYKVSP